MKIQELVEARKKQLPVVQPDDFDDAEEVASDPDRDNIPHIVMQLRSALDVDGNREIHFKDGSKIKLSVDIIKAFLLTYLELDTTDRENMQNTASQSKAGFIKALSQALSKALDIKNTRKTRKDKSIYAYK